MTAQPKRACALDEIIFEFTVVGSWVRVCAVDPKTGVEVVIAGPADMSQTLLERTATAKLLRRLASLEPSAPRHRVTEL